MDRWEFWPATDKGPEGKKKVKRQSKQGGKLNMTAVNHFHLVLARLEKYTVVAVSGLTELVNERQIVFLKNASKKTRGGDLANE